MTPDMTYGRARPAAQRQRVAFCKPFCADCDRPIIASASAVPPPMSEVVRWLTSRPLSRG